MKIYTKKGDTGLTSIIGAHQVPKNDPRLNAYGTVDELNAIIGGVLLHLPEKEALTANEIQCIQKDLFQIGACLARIDQRKVSLPLNQSVHHIEKAIDHMTQSLPPLNAFILPSGHAGAVFSHMARTVCRRAEREVVEFIEDLEPELRSENYNLVQMYLNRLSDYFFSLARYINHCCDCVDVVAD